MLEVLPIGPDAIHRTAERMMADHGRLALDMADRRAGRFRTEGLEPLAHLWELIAAVIEDLQDTKGAGKPHAEFCRELGFPID